MAEDFERILGHDYRDALSTDEQRSQLKEATDFDRFAPNGTPDNATANTYNPAVNGYQEEGLQWGETGWGPIDDTSPLRKYPEYVPTDEAIRTLVDIGPLLEVGAGNGYWTHTINENGGDCVATDLYPRDSTDDEENTIWADVREYDAVDAIAEYPERVVFMCHPSGADRWSERVLDAISEQTFVFVGEWFPGMDANPWFFVRLSRHWNLLDDFPVYNWESTHAHGYVFERSK